MNADEIVNHPIHIQQSLQARRRFGIGIGLASIGGTFPSQRTEKGFGMVGVNLFLFYGLLRFGLFLPRGLILGPFGAFLVGLRSLVLDADLHAFLQRLLRPSGFAIADQFPTDLEQQINPDTKSLFCSK